MHGMFRANGGCGYVKKADFLMKLGPYNKVFDPKLFYPFPDLYMHYKFEHYSANSFTYFLLQNLW
ncbi:hypothetical protein UlMin_032383 [Ulmus minor]